MFECANGQNGADVVYIIGKGEGWLYKPAPFPVRLPEDLIQNACQAYASFQKTVVEGLYVIEIIPVA